MAEKVTIPALLEMKRAGRKSVGMVAWDYQIARIADRAGVDIVSVGDSVGVNLWGHSNPLEVTMEEMLVVCKAVCRGFTRALGSCDFAFGLLLTLARRIHLGHMAMSQGGWALHWGHDVHGKTLGILGCGRIGTAMARRATGFGMRLLSYDLCENCGRILYRR